MLGRVLVVDEVNSIQIITDMFATTLEFITENQMFKFVRHKNGCTS